MKKKYEVIKQEPYLCRWTGEVQDRWSKKALGRYSLKHSGWGFRYVRTMNEKRQNSAALEDGHYVRGKRRHHMLRTVWDDPKVGRNWGRSWKDFTKADKQYNKNT